MKLILVTVKFFGKGAATGIGLGSDAPIFRELSAYPPEKITISMLITAQVRWFNNLFIYYEN